MTSFLLTADEATADAGGFDEVLLWSKSSSRSTFGGPLDEHLSSFGVVRQENVDSFDSPSVSSRLTDRYDAREAGRTGTPVTST